MAGTYGKRHAAYSLPESHPHGAGKRERGAMTDDVQSRLRNCLCTVDHLQDRSRDCRATVDHLQEENQQLRLACEAFGQLAERLHVELTRVRAAAEGTTTASSDESIERTSQPSHLEHLSDVRSRKVSRGESTD
jgi:predicted RNase H-like nuclease (RuvC/YqgF family)